MKGLAVLGSTGSIGTQTLDVVRSYPDRFSVVALAARKSLASLDAQLREFNPKLVSCEGSAEEKASLLSNGCTESAMEDMVRHPDVDLVVSATVGDTALGPTLAAIDAGKKVALANKESVVMAGGLLTDLAERRNVELLPVDSEPNAIWQCLQGERKAIRRLIITASGGAFRDTPPSELASVTPEQALDHPTWNMGPKITIDSATLVNKAFEVIEAHWLFGVPWEDIEVVIHPQSMIHSMVEFVDGSVKAHISPPDMRVPIQYALFHPERVRNDRVARFDPVATSELTFKSWDPERYPCFQLVLDVVKRGGTWPAVVCGADEAAVDMFLAGHIGFLEIESVIRGVTERHEPKANPTIQDILSAGAWAREQAMSAVGA